MSEEPIPLKTRLKMLGLSCLVTLACAEGLDPYEGAVEAWLALWTAAPCP